MNSEQKEKWKKVHSKGKIRFILLRCMLGWGLPVGLIYSLWTHWSENIMIKTQSVIIFMICGLIGGLLYWMAMEQKYRKS
ncbi:hypothetical protein RRV45_01205 [Bacillus sp. DTU_2020_1000418_1_SI_GHA_SEK_038]|uniref:hypothetical protein n=1 Tax=Bacillus sp. DTU_2020_1000418_1_SI_GHA_SEK_038 TaxID=3077585 RepID=UPI0028F0C3B8|nr:hypothetical protein [Bacillus sp. DTU_2020_1000418_1_SI_GHA_SEK_038]WNS75697.1 hypothetical protein RRV45_01205 [Bacillus sp. DTU_2020_1000418_1_SI_GHA_SEK_038]